MQPGRWLYGLIASVLCSIAPTATAQIVVARVSITDQEMMVYVDNALEHVWKVSTARRGYKTPPGSYTPYWLSKNHRSRKYDNAPMPYAVFFHGGYAVHGTTEIKRLGQRASHGCVRLMTENARTLYTLVQQYGKQNVAIVILP
ncbi:MAG: L,D-transpeptidase [Candidatus Paceibacterota bacterium]